MLKTFTANDSPDANGRCPKAGEHRFTLIFVLDDGDVLEIHIGNKGLKAFQRMLRWEAYDREIENDSSCFI